MAYKPTEAQRVEFIKEIAPLAQKAYKTLGKVLPSVCIGMACIESGFGYGTDGSRLMYKNNAILGQKVGSGKTATKYWSGKAFKAATSEEYQVGVHTKLPAAAFRKYDSLEQCIFNYYELLNTSLYKKVIAGCDFATQMKQIKSCGYMTSSTEVNSVIKVINLYNLSIYDCIKQITNVVPENRFVIGQTYTLNKNLYIREQPFGEKMKFSCITVDAQNHSKFDDYGCAILKEGTKVTCKAIKKESNSIWILIPSGWICASEAGKEYIS